MLGFTGNRTWVYAKHVEGRFQRVHRASGALLQALLVITPWLSIGGLPVVRVALPERRLYLLGQVFTASEGFTLVLLGLMAAFGLFFFTALFGRLWCGFLCPQTVFLEEWVRPIEHLVEGDRVARQRRDAGPWRWERAGRRAAKWTAFAVLGLFVGMSVMSWFAGPRALWTGRGGPVDYAMVGVIGTGLFLDWAWFREQLCSYLCPYARFQGALVDGHSLIVSYDRARGEPRGKGKQSAAEGHCVDCHKCVDVCPAGIDIRDGFQLECIACARCVDACESVMPRLGHPSLVRYSTQSADEGRPTRLLRKRTVAYAALLGVLATSIGGRMWLHNPIELEVNRAPGSLFTVEEDGSVRNTFLVHVTNRDPSDPHHYAVAVHGLEDEQVMVPPIELGPLESRTVPMVVRLQREETERTLPFTVEVRSEETTASAEATFKAPARDGGGR